VDFAPLVGRSSFLPGVARGRRRSHHRTGEGTGRTPGETAGNTTDEVVGKIRTRLRASPGRSCAQDPDEAASQTRTRQTQSRRRARRGRTRGQQPGQGGEPDPDEARRPRPGRGDGTRRPARPGRGAAGQTRTKPLGSPGRSCGQVPPEAARRTRQAGGQAHGHPCDRAAANVTGRAPEPNRPGTGAKPARSRRQTGPVPAANRPGPGRPPYVRKITRSLRKARCVPHKAAPAVATSDPRVSSTGAAPGRLPSSTSRTMNSTFSTGTKYVQTATASVSANIKYMLGSITRNASAVMYAWASR